MRRFALFSRILVGVLFILSGLVKANDPLGLSYKMQEFFEVWNSDLAGASFFAASSLISLFNWLHGYSLPISIIMITLEIGAGVALLLGWKKNAVLRLLFLLIVFFTFLTGYALWSGKFKNCGCFGDCLPISPLASFVKDLVLLVLIVALWYGRKYIMPASGTKAAVAVSLSLAAALLLQWYVLHYLPLADCLPYKEGNNISRQMQVPAGARPDSFAIRFIYKKEGKIFEFAASALPADLGTYTYVDRVDRLVRKGNAEPAIKGFALNGISGTDSTTAILELPKAILLLAEDVSAANKDKWLPSFRKIAAQASLKSIPVFIATASSLSGAAEVLGKSGLSSVSFFALDFTAIRTAARANPTLILLEKGTIKRKYSYRQMEKVLADF